MQLFFSVQLGNPGLKIQTANRFSSEQVQGLIEAFEKNRLLSKKDRAEIATKLGLTEHQVTVSMPDKEYWVN